MQTLISKVAFCVLPNFFSFFFLSLSLSSNQQAVVRYNEPIVRLLLLAGADPDRCCTSRNITALQLCVAEGRTPLIEALLAAGASPDIVHPEFGTSVHTATNRNHCVCLRLLCAAGNRLSTS